MAYLFDPTGILPANKIANEEKTVTFGGPTSPYILKPAYGPFYKRDFSIVRPDGISLKEGIDFYFTHSWQEGRLVTGKEIFGTITLINYANILPTGTYRINYQTVGGDYTDPSVVEGFVVLATDELFALSWTNSPDTFPHTDHTHPLQAGFPGVTQIYEQLGKIASALMSDDNAYQMDDIQDFGSLFINPLFQRLDEIVSIIAGGGNLGAMDELNLKYNALVPWETMAGDLSFYDIPIAKFFKTKTGTINYDPAIPDGDTNGKPTAISFPVEFPNACLGIDIKVFMTDDTQVQEHKVVHSKPHKGGVKAIQITPVNDLYPTGSRTIQYTAFGV